MTGNRLESLDVVRGLTIAAMILVSTPGTWDAIYAPLEHASWNGWTPADLVFPFLLFAMGAAVPFAMTWRRGAGRRVRTHVLRRGALLFALGLLLNAIETPPPIAWRTFRIPGVLQRIAIVYLVVAWLTERTSRRTQILVAAGALIGYWVAMTMVPGNFASSIDRTLLGSHLAYGDWDPEGVFSTIPAIATALGGVFAGDWLNQRDANAARRSAVLFTAGLASLLAGLAWDRVFPINKNLWTSSFALFSGGAAAMLLALSHWTLDVKRWRGWELPLVAFGRNPLAAYFLSVSLDAVLTRWMVGGGASLKSELYQRAFASWAVPCCGEQAASLFYALTYVVVWGAIVVMMYRRRVFIGI